MAFATVNVKMLKKMRSEKYKYVDLAARDVTNVISQYKDLKPVMDTYVFNDGSCRYLLCLQGTIPVSYRGNIYNIPVCLWLLDTYPYNPPICFVKPTSAMMTKTGEHIDANGKIYLPYLHEWKHPQSDLYGLIQVMIVVFGENPPVFSRPAAQTIGQPRFAGEGPAPKHLIPMADIGTSIIGNQAAVDPSLSPTLPASEALLRQKILLEIDVLQRQKKVLEMQEEYYSSKQRRLPEDKP